MQSQMCTVCKRSRRSLPGVRIGYPQLDSGSRERSRNLYDLDQNLRFKSRRAAHRSGWLGWAAAAPAAVALVVSPEAALAAGEAVEWGSDILAAKSIACGPPYTILSPKPRVQRPDCKGCVKGMMIVMVPFLKIII